MSPVNRELRKTLSLSMLSALAVLAGLGSLAAAGGDSLPTQRIVLIPGGTFDMGCHDTLGTDDELPIHTVQIDSFFIGNTPVTNRRYCDYLNSAFARGWIEVHNGYIMAPAQSDTYCFTAEAEDSGSSIHFSGDSFAVTALRDDHPMVCVRWFGAAAYCNWLSGESSYTTCYDESTWHCDFGQNGFRLPTEAEWEYAARGGHYGPYYTYPWGNNRDTTRTNWPRSADPYEAGPNPWTTPVGFYDGKLRLKSEFNWPGSQTSFQTSDGANGYGLYDMAGDVWNWCNDWYGHTYYSVSPPNNPTGPDSSAASPMPNGRVYRVLRGGSWYNATHYPGDHSRCSNRDPAYYRGPGDPNGPWFQIGFRVVRPYRGATSVGEGNVGSGRPLSLQVTSPCRGIATIGFGTAASGHIRLTVYDRSGRRIRTLKDGRCAAGDYAVTWDGADDAGRIISPGIYMCRLDTGGTAACVKLLKLD